MTPPVLLALSLALPLTLPTRADWARLRVSVIYFWRHDYFPDLVRPRRFNEWVQWRKLKDRDLSLAALTDKLKAKTMAVDVLGQSLVIPTLWRGDQLPRFPVWTMPFVVKANHGCGQFVVVRCLDDWRLAQRLAPRWLRATYGKWLDEWHYRAAERTLLIEPFIGLGDTLPLDYKVFVFGGVARFVQVHIDRATDHRWVQFTRNWDKLSNVTADIDKPVRLAEMLEAAEKMAFGHDHLRVDFYEVDGKLWFGETCLFPGSGLDRFDPVTLDEIFGAMWNGSRATRH